VPRRFDLPRMLSLDGSLLETVQFKKDNDRPNEPNQEDVDRWVDTSPVRVLSK
jgi:hypothetical protein